MVSVSTSVRLYSLVVLSTTLESLGLVSLKSVQHGNVLVAYNSRLCYVGNMGRTWAEILRTPNQTTAVGQNMASDDCGRYTVLFEVYTVSNSNIRPPEFRQWCH